MVGTVSPGTYAGSVIIVIVVVTSSTTAVQPPSMLIKALIQGENNFVP